MVAYRTGITIDTFAFRERLVGATIRTLTTVFSARVVVVAKPDILTVDNIVLIRAMCRGKSGSRVDTLRLLVMEGS